MSDSVLGLRERKKQATRVALGNAALRLAVQHGLDNVTVEGIAAEVEVSTRTFFNYFSSKEEAMLADSQQRVDLMLAAMRARPQAEAPLIVIRNAVLEVLGETGEPNREWAEQVRLVHTTPSLLPHQMAEYAKVERRMAEVIAERTGTDLARDVYPALVAAVANGAVRVAAFWWMEHHSSASLAELVTEVLDVAAAGLVPPAT